MGRDLSRREMRCRNATEPRGDAGYGLVEILVSLMLLAIVVVPVTRIVLATHDSADLLHRRAEAADLATQSLESAQYQAASGAPLITGVTTSTSLSGKDTFQVSLDLEVLPQSGVGTLCTSAAGSTSTQIWQATATVTWGGATAAGDRIVERTLVAPQQADLASTTAGEIAVPVYTTVASSMTSTTTTTSPGSPAALPTTLETATPISVTVTGKCSLTSCSQPSGSPAPVTSETENTGTTGCAVFPNLWAGTGWVYTVTVQGNPGWVDPNEGSDATTANGLPTLTVSGIAADAVTQPIGQVVLDQGDTVTVKFADNVDTGLAAAPFLPVTFVSPAACGSSGLCVLGGAATSFATAASSAQTALLFPFPSGGTNYAAYAGGATDANPTAYSPSPSPTTFEATSGATSTLTLPVYPLVLNLKINSDAKVVSQLVATDGGNDAIDLNYSGGSTSSTSMPLGEFELSATTTGTSSKLSFASNQNPVYVLVTPSGVCESSSPETTCSTPTPYSTGTSVTVG